MTNLVKKKFFSLLAGSLGSFLILSCSAFQGEDPQILVFSKTSGFHHESIAEGNRALLKMGAENGIEVDTTTNSALITDENLAQYAAVVFLNTTGNILNEEQQEAFERFIKAGGGFVGVHSAADTEYDWEWYGELIGAYFESHPEIQVAELNVEDHKHLSAEQLPAQWTRFDEWYNYKQFNEKVNVLLTIDEDSYEGGKHGDFHPIAWYHEFDGGRIFYTGLGHTDGSYTEPLFLKHLLGGLRYAIGIPD